MDNFNSTKILQYYLNDKYKNGFLFYYLQDIENEIYSEDISHETHFENKGFHSSYGEIFILRTINSLIEFLRQYENFIPELKIYKINFAFLDESVKKSNFSHAIGIEIRPFPRIIRLNSKLDFELSESDKKTVSDLKEHYFPSLPDPENIIISI